MSDKRYLVIDCETNGLPNYKLPADDPGQPRLAQLCMLVVDERQVDPEDEFAMEAFGIRSETSFMVSPDGWAMHPDATAVNGLTDAILREYGVPVRDALEAYVAEIDAGCVVVAHNARNDLKILRGELRRAGMPDRFEQTPNICTMRALTSRCALRQRNGAPKWPNLNEALRHFDLPPTPANPHNAVTDAAACFELLRKMHELGIMPTPQVFYAKDGPARSAAANPAEAAAARQDEHVYPSYTVLE